MNHARRPLRHSAVPAILLFAAATVLAAPIRPDGIFLRDGRYIQAEVLEATARGVTLKLVETGGTVFLRWEALREEEQRRVKVMKGLLEEDLDHLLVEPGKRLILRNGNRVEGLVRSETQEAVTFQNRGRVAEYLRSSILRVEDAEVSVLEIWTMEELYTRKLAEIKPTDDDVVGHFEMAKYARAIGAYDKAIDHLVRVREINPDYKADYVRNQLPYLELLHKNKAIGEAMARARQHVFRNQFDLAIGILAELEGLKEVKDSEKLTRDIQRDRKRFEEQRWAFFQKKVVSRYLTLLKRFTDDLSRDPKMDLEKAKAHMRKGLHEQIVERIAKDLGIDGKKEVEPMWTARKIHRSEVASYGSGTFIVDGDGGGAGGKSQQADLQRLRELYERARQNRGRQSQAAQPQVEPPKLATPEEWWKAADSAERAQWMRAYFVEQGKKLTIVGERNDECGRCGGTGQLQQLTTQGETTSFTCPRCHGLRRDRGFTYR